MKRLSLLDLLCRRYPERDRERLLALILCRDVIVDGGRIVDPRESVSFDAHIEIHEDSFVSRGGVKLQYALDLWNVTIQDKVFIDAGSSTGGFTDCLLQHGAKHIYAVDVGYNQLAYQLRRDDRVTVMEQTNIMHVSGLDPMPDAAVADLSFRSIGGAASHIIEQTQEGWMIALIKPQFELQHEIISFDGVIRDTSVVEKTMLKVFSILQDEGVGMERFVSSPIRGAKGNREYLAMLRKYDQLSVPLLPRTAFAELLRSGQ